MTKRLFLLIVGVFALWAVAVAVQAQSTINVPAQKEGWWIRLNPTNQAPRVYWRFGPTAKRIGAPIMWVRGTSPEAVDVPVAERTQERIYMAALGMPPAAPVSFCVFFQEHGVALIEFTQETTAELDRNQNAPECVP
jgi:hypothetical protein